MRTENLSTTPGISLRTITVRIAAAVVILTIGVSALLTRPASAFQDRGGRGGTSQPLPVLKTKLESRSYSGGDLDSSHPWEKTVTLTIRARLYFRWSTTEQGVTAAQWQVTDSPGGFPTLPVAPPANILAQGQAQPIPSPGQARIFDIDFGQLLPATPSNPPRVYYVRIVPQKGVQKLSPSSSVKITYKKPGTQPAPDFDEVNEANIAAFATNVKSRLNGKTTGYSYAIFDGEKLKQNGAGGFAVLPNVPQSADRRMTTVSMTKTITATAVMKAMEQMKAQGKTISIDSLIAPFLPSHWSLGPHVSEMTFRDLLRHTSGLRSLPDEDTYNSLKKTIANGSTDDNFRVGKYQNPNFSLFRIIIPYMLRPRAELESSLLGVLSEDLLETRTSDFYISFVKQHVLGPIGLGGVSLAPSGPQEHVRYYSFFHPHIFAVDYPYDFYRRRVGSGHWFMSAKEFARFIAGLRAGRIVSASTFKLMKDNQLGMYADSTKLGTCLNHNGGFGDGSTGGLVCDWMIFPNGITAVVFANSAGGPVEAPQDVLKNAFNASQW